MGLAVDHDREANRDDLTDGAPPTLADAAGRTSPRAVPARALPPVRAGRPRAAGPSRPSDDPDGVLAVKPRTRPQKPSMYKVLLLNDDYTPMEFVVHVLERFFGITHEQAVEIMLTVHRRGVAVVGVFSFEVAETKVTQVMDYAQQHQHPLQCTMEKE
ncbi:ATP-dependent Clp protease adaptor protein ClpS [Albimonas pacifica]|uniref:ATP-dependent Clp protease adapter protein ClpS n=1 Tax=Albimonas pacifica TaxID=1114924 RepID=A0A1I3E0M8_9RHOB|nr:ATP-dependent Clp protease adaptor protein ClpS [Albimonas pacifica]